MKSILPYAAAHQQMIERRSFIAGMLKASLASAFIFSVGDANARDFLSANKTYTVGDVMDLLLKEIPGAPFDKTVDTLKSGNREIVVSGIITTMFATVDIIHQAIKQGANFIIAHEPTFYNHSDDTNWVANNHIVKLKHDLLEKNKIAVWRLHDYWHAYKPDGIIYGVAKKAGWLSYYKPPSTVLTLPAISLENLAKHLKKQLNIAHVRVIGNLSQKCERIALLPGAWGGQLQMGTAEKEKPDVLIVGEVHEWETAEYIRDGLKLGEKTSLIVLGHSVSEEPGMEWLAEWLQPKLQGVKVQHMISGNPFVGV